MVIQLKKFGTLLISRQAGKEALAAFEPTLREIKDEEIITIDFEGVSTLAPSWADEFLTSLFRRYQNRLSLHTSDNASVQATVKFLEQIHNFSFPKK